MPREVEYNHYAKFWGINTIYYGICESRELSYGNVLEEGPLNVVEVPTVSRLWSHFTKFYLYFPSSPQL